MSEVDVAQVAFEEGARQSAILKDLMDKSEGEITEAMLDALWDSADDRVVEILASAGNNVASRVAARRRQTWIEEALADE